MNQLIGITDWYVMPHVGAGITFPRLVAPKFGLPTDEDKIAASIVPATVCLAEITRLLGDQPFLAGDALSIADLMLAPQMAMFSEVSEGVRLLAPHPKLSAWIARMTARPSMVNTTWDRLLETPAAA